MSLVSDALKKAQHDAAVREAREKGLPERLVSSSQPWRARRSGGGRALTITLAAVALLAVGSLAVYLLARPPARPGATTARLAAEPVAAPVSTQEAPGDGPVGSGAALRDPVSPAAPESTAPGPPPANRDPGPAKSATATPAPSPAAPKAQPGSGKADRVFVREAILDDGVVIRLGGIAWSETAPLAFLNGRLIGTGESVSGYRIVRIERDRVQLAGTGGRIVLALR